MIQDTRLQHVKDGLYGALGELGQPCPNIPRVVALLDDARTDLVDVVESGLSTSPKADLNQLDSVRLYINRAMTMLGKEWAFSSAEQFISHALDHLDLVIADNVVPLSRYFNGGVA